MSWWTDGAAPAGVEDSIGSANEEPAVSQDAASSGPAEVTSATDGSPRCQSEEEPTKESENSPAGP